MIIVAPKANWLKAVIPPAKASSGKTVTLLDNILIREDLSIRGCDAATFVETKLVAEPAVTKVKSKPDALSFLVNGKPFLKAIQMMPEGEVKVENSDKQVVISSNGAIMKLGVGPPVGDFPEMLRCDAETGYPALLILDCAKRFMWAAAEKLKGMTSALNGLLIESTTGRSWIGATDKKTIQVMEGPSYGEMLVSISAECLDVASGAEEVFFGTGIVKFTGENLLVVAPIAHTTVSFQGIEERTFHQDQGFNVPRSTMAEAVERSMAVASTLSSHMPKVIVEYKVDAGVQTVTVSATGADASQEYRETLDVTEGRAEPFIFACQGQYLSGSLGGFSVETVDIHFPGETTTDSVGARMPRRAVCISSPSEPATRSIVMPMSL